MKYNPFSIAMTAPYRKQPQRRMRHCCQQQPMNTLVNGMVTLGSVAIIGGTTVGVLNAIPKG